MSPYQAPESNPRPTTSKQPKANTSSRHDRYRPRPPRPHPAVVPPLPRPPTLPRPRRPRLWRLRRRHHPDAGRRAHRRCCPLQHPRINLPHPRPLRPPAHIPPVPIPIPKEDVHLFPPRHPRPRRLPRPNLARRSRDVNLGAGDHPRIDATVRAAAVRGVGWALSASLQISEPVN
ncbi:hypothetical protein B0T18DRAFT_442408 [Schizothecium vesticola]|uniref:Uncharacterized protein n=1 Tax=Schizothecium vesticola TaxID=314040 RepID=A0AA40KC97_9PEZI|nr:hypothetical protein B0T18DRAFT_442408 [Schizothecium vesticola]